jgi:hypothetical protein
MADKPPFDPIRAAFWLVALVAVVQCVVVILFAAACFVNAREIMASQQECDPNSRLMALMSSALAAALAFVGLGSRGR